MFLEFFAPSNRTSYCFEIDYDTLRMSLEIDEETVLDQVFSSIEEMEEFYYKEFDKIISESGKLMDTDNNYHNKPITFPSRKEWEKHRKIKEKWELISKIKSPKTGENWGSDIIDIIHQYDIDSMGKGHLQELTEDVFCDPISIKHPKWGGIICAIADISPSFEELAERRYGKRISASQMDTDGGDDDYNAVRLSEEICDDGLYTTDICMHALKQPDASKREDFIAIVNYVLSTVREKLQGIESPNERLIRAFLEIEHIKKHPDYNKITT